MDTGSKKIARVFPRRTSATPHDELAFVGAITMETIAAIARAEPSEIHISATFTWDLPDVDELYESYSVFGVPVEVGGPAFGDRMGDFVPGMYIREGLVFTSRGCNKNCWFCSVPKCCNGEIRELPIVDGWNILDDNVLATSIDTKDWKAVHFKDRTILRSDRNLYPEADWWALVSTVDVEPMKEPGHFKVVSQ